MPHKGKDLHPVFLTTKELLVVFYISPLQLPGALPGDKQHAFVVQELTENWNTQLIKKGNAMRQSTNLLLV